MADLCKYPGCNTDLTTNRPYARKRDGIPSASTIAGLIDDNKARSFAWAATLIAATEAVHHPENWSGLVGQQSERAIKNGYPDECTHTKDGLCKACMYLRSEFDREWTAKANLGTHIHHLALSWAQGEAVETDDTTGGYMDALERFYKDTDPEFHFLERTVLYNRSDSHKYRGTFDMIATLTRDGERRKGLWDLKTGGFYATEQTLQLAGYAHATWMTSWDTGTEVQTGSVPAVQDTGVLLLHSDGTYHLADLPANGDAFGTFLRLRDTWGWCRKMDQWKRDHPLENPE